MEKKTKILAVGDIHGDTGLAKKLAEKAKKENVDLIILAGDLTWLDQSFQGIVGPFIKAKKQVLLIPGNHEPNSTINFLAEMYPNTKNIHGYPHKIGNLGIFGAGYDSKVGPFWVEDEEIFKTLKKSHDKIKDMKRKIMVTHALPAESKSELFEGSGSEAVKKAITKFKPDIVISGHIHEAGGIEEKIGKTKVINVSRKPKIFEI
ncbi:metallophosphoesterase [Candidatus Pacearchaeota archaeon]|nr:metallophosphoesterase [Candidatus Pacearchaeota archaeon]